MKGHTKIFAKYGALEAVEQWARGLVALRLAAFARGRVGRLRLLAWRRAKFEQRFARELPLIKSVQAVARAARARADLAVMLRDASLLRARREAEAARLAAEKSAAEARRKAQLARERERARLYDAVEGALACADLASESAAAAVHGVEALIKAVREDMQNAADDAVAVARAALAAAPAAAAVDSMFSSATLARARCARMQKLDALMRTQLEGSSLLHSFVCFNSFVDSSIFFCFNHDTVAGALASGALGGALGGAPGGNPARYGGSGRAAAAMSADLEGDDGYITAYVRSPANRLTPAIAAPPEGVLASVWQVSVLYVPLHLTRILLTV